MNPAMPQPLDQRRERDRGVWDACAESYERRIVAGHPDVLAYEAFEDDLLDRVVRHLAQGCSALRVYDIGCGSGRVHQRFGMQVAARGDLSAEEADLVEAARAADPRLAFDPLLGNRLVGIGGIDFSSAMLELARAKLRRSGLQALLDAGRLSFDHGSAFALRPFGRGVPLVVCLCNTIGVMQGPEGARALFESVRGAVEPQGGVAIISAYRRAAVASQALGNYESTMDVGGQPAWLVPNDFPAPAYRKIPLGYKRAHDPSDRIQVDVVDGHGVVVKAGHLLARDPQAVAEAIASGHIRTETDYESRWYDDRDLDAWIAELWGGDGTRIDGRRLDALRAEPVQLAVYDPAGRLAPLLARWAGR